MTIQKFLDQIFQSIQDKCPESTIEYQFKAISNTHFIKVTPESVFSSDAFIDIDFDFSDRFYAQGFDSDLCFLTEGSLVELDNPTVIYNPKKDVRSYGFDLKAESILTKPLLYEVEIDLFNDTYTVINSFLLQPKENVSTKDSYNLLSQSAQSILSEVQISIPKGLEVMENNLTEGNSKFAMAA